MKANDMQVGGTHYQREYQHWDMVTDTGMHYLLGCATKYIARWPNKNADDLIKATHYLQKAMECDILPFGKVDIQKNISEFVSTFTMDPLGSSGIEHIAFIEECFSLIMTRQYQQCIDYITEVNNSSAVKGRVKWFNNEKGYGFIIVEGEDDDIFVHHEVVQMDGFRRLNEDQEVLLLYFTTEEYKLQASAVWPT